MRLPLTVTLIVYGCPKCVYTTLRGCSFQSWRPTVSLPLPRSGYRPAIHKLRYSHHVPSFMTQSSALTVQTSTNDNRRSLHLRSCLLGAAAVKGTKKQLSDIRRLNSLNIQMLSKPLHKQIFANRRPRCSRNGVLRSKQHLSEQGLWDKPGTILPDIDVQLPKLQGNNIDEHFTNIANRLNEPYLSLAVELSQASLPPMPRDWSFQSGWTRYDEDGCPAPVSHPSSQALVFDVEVCVKESPRPILAVAVSNGNWYSWVSERLSSGEDFYVNTLTTADDLIPLEGSACGEGMCDQERLIVGHNICYDRARIREQYLIQNSKTRFLDTMSLHTCVAGQTTFQKILWKASHKNSSKTPWEPWMEISSPNSLVDVYWCHVSRGKKRISKEQRDVFVKGSVQDVRNDFQNSMLYCAKDVLHTHELLKKVLPQFMERYPHPVTFAGMLEMGTTYLPVNYSWEQYVADAEYTYEEMEREMKSKLMALADEACSHVHNSKYLTSPWLCNLDWKTKVFRGKAMKTKRSMKELLESVEERWTETKCEDETCNFLISSNDLFLPSRAVHMPGHPEWYRHLCLKRTDPRWRPGAVNISAQTRITPYLLRMKWKGHPLYHHQKLGWGYIISMETSQEEEELEDVADNSDPCKEQETDLSLEDMMEEYYDKMEDREKETKEEKAGGNDCGSFGTLITSSQISTKKGTSQCIAAPVPHEQVSSDPDVEVIKNESESWKAECIVTEWGVSDDVVTIGNGQSYLFFKVPHKDGTDANCGNPLSKDYLPKMEDGTLTSGAGRVGRRILTLNSMMSFWRSARSRIMQQFVVWLNKERGHCNDEDAGSSQRGEVGAILPQVVVAGTATRRAVEPTWLTASNAKSSRVGSEQKAMIQAPPGYHIVGADVDSQELWIAAVLGDVHFAGIHGSTAIGWMTLQGKKSDQSDVHSNTAKTIGISRDHAKILNYGRFYGAGKPFIELLLRKFNPSLTSREIEKKAEMLYSATKGTRMYKLTKKGQKVAMEMDIPLVEECLVSPDNWRLMYDVLGYFGSKKLLSSRLWFGGSESHLFNKLESIAMSEQARTPVLGCSISRALERQYVGNQFQPSRVNWVVQSSAVDYLHLLLVSCQWMFKQYEIDGRFCISIHDEVRYLVKSEDRYRAALALQYANLFTRAMFAYKLDLQDLPMAVAFFSGVDIDQVLRKEAAMDCKTPSNPLGMEKGHGIPNGEVLDMYQILERTSGRLHK